MLPIISIFKWPERRPEFGPDWLICAEFARQRVYVLRITIKVGQMTALGYAGGVGFGCLVSDSGGWIWGFVCRG